MRYPPGFILSGVFELVASQSYRIALQRVAQLRQVLALQRIKRRAGGGWRHAVGDCRRLIQRNLSPAPAAPALTPMRVA